MTIAGQHTVGELGDLWAALSFELDALTKASNAAAASWRAVDSAGYLAFSVGLSKFQAYVSETIVPTLSPMLAASTSSLAVTASLQDGVTWLADAWQNGQTPGFNALDAMMRKAPQVVAAMAPTYKGIPQPKSPDFDLRAYQLADAAAKWIGQAASTGGTVALVVVGLVVVYLLARRN